MQSIHSLFHSTNRTVASPRVFGPLWEHGSMPVGRSFHRNTDQGDVEGKMAMKNVR